MTLEEALAELEKQKKLAEKASALAAVNKANEKKLLQMEQAEKEAKEKLAKVVAEKHEADVLRELEAQGALDAERLAIFIESDEEKTLVEQVAELKADMSFAFTKEDDSEKKRKKKKELEKVKKKAKESDDDDDDDDDDEGKVNEAIKERLAKRYKK
jgi:hypothetical protein